MNLQYRRLESGFHYVRDTDSHHLFAQWPVGESLAPEHVSVGLADLHPERLRLFMSKAEDLSREGDSATGAGSV